MEANVESLVNANKIPGQKSAQDQKIMGKDDFLKLMMIQMRHQDPLNPLDNAQMLSQMAQFTSLEQLSNLNNTLTQQNTLASQMDSTRLLGKIVATIDPASPPEDPRTLSSKVRSCAFTNQGAVLGLDNGMSITVDQVIGVMEG